MAVIPTVVYRFVWPTYPLFARAGLDLENGSFLTS
ncbi:unnamed protein product [Protopolystoma xenopodis]|uniref:Uncharacterized protein n=1 Tax=Protopolystoma xenopodis TaxID=117903 RepID=A0A3S5CIH6_9PLAT|nr:unnamed protein product [Protopolystoma xenopodis]